MIDPNLYVKAISTIEAQARKYANLLKECKRWQERAGSFATLANFAALTALENDLSENDIDQLNEIIDTVRPYLIFDEKE